MTSLTLLTNNMKDFKATGTKAVNNNNSLTKSVHICNYINEWC